MREPGAIGKTTQFDPDRLRQPRIVLIASAFPQTVMATVVWLSEMGVDFSLVRVQAYRTDLEVVPAALLLPRLDPYEAAHRGIIAASTRNGTAL